MAMEFVLQFIHRLSSYLNRHSTPVLICVLQQLNYACLQQLAYLAITSCELGFRIQYEMYMKRLVLPYIENLNETEMIL